MALSCPRCGTEVQTEAQYCPYCSLPKPKRGFVAVEEEKPEEASLPEVPRPPAPIRAPRRASSKRPTMAKTAKIKTAKRPSARPEKPSRKIRLPILAAIVAVVSIGIYIFVVPLVYSEHAEPKTVLAALDKLRKAPSNEPEVTIDAKLSRELEKARRVGNLVAYQGWVVKPIRGTKSRVILAFSYKEVGDVFQSAEWIADLTTGTFTPQTDLATSVSN